MSQPRARIGIWLILRLKVVQVETFLNSLHNQYNYQYIALYLFSCSNKDARYENIGYNNSNDFFSGTSMFNESLNGWAGFRENGSSLGSPRGLKRKEINLYFHIIYLKKSFK